jgi:hypothetical protein
MMGFVLAFQVADIRQDVHALRDNGQQVGL